MRGLVHGSVGSPRTALGRMDSRLRGNDGWGLLPWKEVGGERECPAPLDSGWARVRAGAWVRELRLFNS